MNIERALTVDGFMLPEELIYIAECASKSHCIVEVGSYQGRSGRAWADNALGIVFCVDIWRDGGEPNFYSNLSDVLESKVHKVKMPSQVAANMFQNAGITFDCIFIDADHDYNNIYADILAWMPLLRPGGIICGHDFQPSFPGVMQAVQELIPKFSIVGGSIWTTEKTKKQIIPIDFPKNDNWLDGPLPVSPTVPSGWTGLERIMPALVEMFCKQRDWALEFGVEYTYSTNVLAQLFSYVTGVDWFKGDEHSMWRDDYSEIARANIAHRNNVELIQSSYQDWIAQAPADAHYDLIHVDVVHTYEATYECGRWAADHAPVVIFHDSEYIWPEVKRAILRIAEETDRTFYNYPECFGLGILA
jgi:predicted O-methyltransferase YrrM